MNNEKNFHQLCVTCPERFKDSLIGDLIDFYSPQDDKVLIICQTQKQTEFIYYSQDIELKKRFFHSHSHVQKGQKAKFISMFRNSKDIRCLVATQIQSIFQFPLEVKLLVFASPPKNSIFYQRSLQKIQNLRYCVIVYTQDELSHLNRIKIMRDKEFIELDPPDVCDMKKDQVSVENKNTVFIKNLPSQAQKQQILSFFGTSGIWVKNITVQKETTKPYKFAIAQFYNEKTYRAALKLTQSTFDQRIIQISKYKKK